MSAGFYTGFIAGGGTSEEMPNNSEVYNSERWYMQCFPILRVNVTL